MAISLAIHSQMCYNEYVTDTQLQLTLSGFCFAQTEYNGQQSGVNPFCGFASLASMLGVARICDKTAQPNIGG